MDGRIKAFFYFDHNFQLQLRIYIFFFNRICAAEKKSNLKVSLHRACFCSVAQSKRQLLKSDASLTALEIFNSVDIKLVF
jgi:hypothetical protein